MIGLIKANDNRVFQVRQRNYVGQNFGVITTISEGEINLKELFQDGAGDWAERQTKIMLQERSKEMNVTQLLRAFRKGSRASFVMAF